MSDRDVDIVAREVDMVRRRRNPQIHVRDDFSANRPSRLTSHFAAKSGDVLTVENAALLTLQQPFGADGDPVQCIADHGQVIASSFGEDQPLPFAMEELEPKCSLRALSPDG